MKIRPGVDHGHQSKRQLKKLRQKQQAQQPVVTTSLPLNEAAAMKLLGLEQAKQAPLQATAAAPASDGSALDRYRPKMMAMADAGQLWAREGKLLRRITAGEAKERLEDGLPVTLVYAQPNERTTSSHMSSSFDYHQGFWNRRDLSEAYASSQSVTVTVHYRQSDIKKWSSVDWVEAGEGILHLSHIPASGASITLKLHDESEFRQRNSHSWGIFNKHNVSASASGQTVTDYVQR